MKPEQRWWQSIKTNLPSAGDRLDRVENSLSSGAPDVNGCMDSEDIWLELKAPIEPKRAGTKLIHGRNHELLLSQRNWFARQKQAGGIAFILVRTDKRVMLIDGTIYADTFNNLTVGELTAISLYHFPVPIKKDNWRLLRHVITTATRHRRLHSILKPK